MSDSGIAPVRPGEQGARSDVSAHPGAERIGIPPGKTRFDWRKGEVKHLGSDTVLTDEIPEIGNLQQVGDQHDADDRNMMRSVLAFADANATLTIAGSSIPLDPCAYFPIDRTPFDTITLEVGIPTDVYMVASARSRPFSDIQTFAAHMDRVGPAFTATVDGWTPLPFQTVGTAHNEALTDEVARGKLHTQNFPMRTFVLENTGTDAFRVRLVGKASHHGFGRWTNVEPSELPVTIQPGDTEIITNNGDAWHLQRLEVAPEEGVASADVTTEYEFTGVSA